LLFCWLHFEVRLHSRTKLSPLIFHHRRTQKNWKLFFHLRFFDSRTQSLKSI
jgi:hypothetical protein